MNHWSDTNGSRHPREWESATNSTPVRSALAIVVVMLVSVCVFQTRSAQSSSETTSQAAPKPLLLEKNEGERRIWREPPPSEKPGRGGTDRSAKPLSVIQRVGIPPDQSRADGSVVSLAIHRATGGCRSVDNKVAGREDSNPKSFIVARPTWLR